MSFLFVNHTPVKLRGGRKDVSCLILTDTSWCSPVIFLLLMSSLISCGLRACFTWFLFFLLCVKVCFTARNVVYLGECSLWIWEECIFCGCRCSVLQMSNVSLDPAYGWCRSVQLKSSSLIHGGYVRSCLVDAWTSRYSRSYGDYVFPIHPCLW